MAGYRLLLVLVAFQERAEFQEAHRGVRDVPLHITGWMWLTAKLAVLPGQIA